MASRGVGLFYGAALGFTLGIFFRSFVDGGFALGVLVLFLGAIIGLLSFREKRVFIIAFVLVGIGGGFLRLDIAELRAPQVLENRVGARTVLTGIVTDEPDERGNHTKLAVTIVNNDGKKEGRVLVTTDVHPRYAYGDRLRIVGGIQLPKTFEEEGRVFDYPMYLRKEGICCVMYYPQVEKIAESKGNVIVATLFNLKDAFLERVSRVIPEPQNALLAGLVVGAKQSLGEQYLELFRRVGIIHIVVLSGYNLLVVARFLMGLLEKLRPPVKTGVGMVGIVLFAIMTGASATTVRASAMALLSLAAQATSRLYLVTRALVVAGLLMLIVNPYLLVFDASFQLSFLATVGLIYFSPYFERVFSWVPKRFALREIAAATVATQLAVLPLLLYQTGLFSLVSLPVNLLILPIIPLTMFLGFLTGMLGFISVWLSLPFAYLSHLLLSYIFLISQWFNKLPFAAYDLGEFPLWALALSYGALVALVVWKRKIVRPTTRASENVALPHPN